MSEDDPKFMKPGDDPELDRALNELRFDSGLYKAGDYDMFGRRRATGRSEGEPTAEGDERATQGHQASAASRRWLRVKPWAAAGAVLAAIGPVVVYATLWGPPREQAKAPPTERTAEAPNGSARTPPMSAPAATGASTAASPTAPPASAEPAPAPPSSATPAATTSGARPPASASPRVKQHDAVGPHPQAPMAPSTAPVPEPPPVVPPTPTAPTAPPAPPKPEIIN
jgi:hypothetical protein